MCADWQPISKSVVEPASDSEQLVLHAKDEIKKLKALLEQYKTKEQQVINDYLCIYCFISVICIAVSHGQTHCVISIVLCEQSLEAPCREQ